MAGSWARKIVLYGIVGLILIAFIVFYGGPGSRSGSRDAVAKVQGEEIPLEVFRVYRRGQSEQEERLQAMGMKGPQVQQLLDGQVLSFLVQQVLVSHRSQELGFRVTDEELRKEICSNPMMLENGRCNAGRLARVRQSQGFESERTYVGTLRRELLVRKLGGFIEETIRISDATARDELHRERTSLRLDFVSVRADDFRADVKVSDDEVATFAKDQTQRVQDAYDLRISEFKRPEQLHIRHMLFTGEKADEEAANASKRLADGGDFAALAMELSKDPATATSGGDLGLLSKEQMLPEFAAAALTAELNKVLGPVKTARGVHLLRVEERQPALDVTLDQAKPQLARELLIADRASERARAKAQQVSAAIASGKTLGDAAKEVGLAVQQTPQFNTVVRAIPGLDPVPGLRETALALRTDRPASDRIFGEQDVFYLISLAERTEPKDEDLAGDLEAARSRLETQMRSQAGEQLYRSLYQEAEQDGEIKSYGLEGA